MLSCLFSASRNVSVPSNFLSLFVGSKTQYLASSLNTLQSQSQPQPQEPPVPLSNFHVFNYPTSSLTGTITNAQLAGSVANAKLANSSVS